MQEQRRLTSTVTILSIVQLVSSVLNRQCAVSNVSCGWIQLPQGSESIICHTTNIIFPVHFAFPVTFRFQILFLFHFCFPLDHVSHCLFGGVLYYSNASKLCNFNFPILFLCHFCFPLQDVSHDLCSPRLRCLVRLLELWNLN